MNVDVVVIGGGFAGLTAACRAAQLGCSVAVLERESDEVYLCSSRYSSGVISVASTFPLVPTDTIYANIMRETADTADPALAKALASTIPTVIDWLRDEGAAFDDSPAFGSPRFQMAPRRASKEGLDWPDKGPDRLLRQMRQTLESRGGQLLLGVEARWLITGEDGACIGVEASRDGDDMRFDCAAVVIADGGFQANREMVGRYISRHPEKLLLRAAGGGTGDGIRMAEAAGAATGGFRGFYGHLMHRDAMTNERLWPYPHFDAVAVATLLVQGEGRRFVDEGTGGVHMTNAIARLDDPLSSFVIFDEAVWSEGAGKAFSIPVNPYLIDGGGWMHSAGSVEGLAREAGLPPEALVETVAEYNRAVRESDLTSLSPPRTTAKGKPVPLETPPFHAVPLCAGITVTMGGIKITPDSQARRADGSTIPGLYAVGTPVADLEGGPRDGYVGGLAKALTFGFRAAEHIAQSR